MLRKILQRNIINSLSRNFGARTPIKMSALSPTMENGTIAEWLVKEGDLVEEEASIAVIETDKAKVQLKSNEEGYIAKLLFPEGKNGIPVGEIIGWLVEDKKDLENFKVDENSASNSNNKTEKEIEKKVEDVVEKNENKELSINNSEISIDKIFISPKAKALATKNNIDIKNVKGTGINGRIISENINDHVANNVQIKKPIEEKISISIKDSPSTKWFEISPSNTRKVIAKRLSESKREIPHFYLESTICMDKLLIFKNKIFEETNKKISINDFLIKAVSLACQKIPETRSQWVDQTIRQFHDSDVCFAVDTPSGLITPMIKLANKKSLSSINEECKDLIKRAKENALKPEEYIGGTFTISNLGTFGIESFSAVINPPQSCILAIGATIDTPTKAESSNDVVWKKSMKVMLSCDHRVVDGAIGAKWLSEFKKVMEDPLLLVL